jgi:hypothetical protein
LRRALPRLFAALAALAVAVALYSGAWFADDALRLWRISLNWILTGSPDLVRGHHVLAFSQPLWVMLLSLGFSVGGRLAATAVALQFMLFAVGVLLLHECHRMTRAETRSSNQLLSDASKVLAVAALLCLSNSFREFMASGQEFALVFFLTGLVAYALSRASREPDAAVTLRRTAFCSALLVMARFDLAWAVLPLFAAGLWRLRAAPGSSWRSLILGLCPLGLWLAYAWIHFGTVFSARPDNFVLLGLPRAALVRHGEVYLAGALVQDPFTFLLLALAVVAGVASLRGPRRSFVPLLLGIGALVFLSHVAWSGGDTVSGRMLCPVACLSAAALACAPAFRVRTYLFAGCYAVVFFDTSRASLLGSSESRRPRTVGIFREWGISDEYAGYRPLTGPVANLTAGDWKQELRKPRSTEPALLSSAPGLDGLLVGPGRDVEDWREVGPARVELDGTAALTVKFNPANAGELEPMLSFGDPATGTELIAEHLPGGGLRYQIWRKGQVPVFTQAVHSLDNAASHRLVVHYGSRTAGGPTHGSFGVMMDGVRLKEYASELRRYDPGEIIAGWNTLGAPGCLRRFRGEIVSLKAADEGELATGSWPLLALPRTFIDLRVRFSSVGNSDEPVIVTGREKAGDIVFVRRLDLGRVVFGVEHWGEAPFFGPPMDIDDGAEHVMTVALGPLFAHSDAIVRPDCIRVTLDGRSALETREQPYPFTANEVYALDNPLAGSFSSRDFQGEVISVSTRSAEPAIASAKAVIDAGIGPVSMRLRFDGSSVGWGLGLLEAGAPGAGCIVYVVNEDATHVRFFLDHWGVGALNGPSVKIDRTRPYDLKIEMGALNDPADTTLGSSDHVRYSLDGRTVLEGISYWPPAGRVPVQLLDNAFKSSNVAIPFDGTCLSVSRGGRSVDFPK